MDNGYRYWFIEEEIKELHKASQQFHVQTVEYEMLMQGFEKPEADEDCFMTTAKILTYLQGYTSIRLSEKRMGEALHKAGFDRISKRINKGSGPVYCYRIKKIKPNPFFDPDV